MSRPSNFSLDPFVEEDMHYAHRLIRAGSQPSVWSHRVPSTEFDLLVPGAEVSKRFSARCKSALRKAFATGEAV